MSACAGRFAQPCTSTGRGQHNGCKWLVEFVARHGPWWRNDWLKISPTGAAWFWGAWEARSEGVCIAVSAPSA